jgi:hypothetical protein
MQGCGECTGRQNSLWEASSPEEGWLESTGMRRDKSLHEGKEKWEA